MAKTAKQNSKTQTKTDSPVSALVMQGNHKTLIMPRLSEKAAKLAGLNKYVFKITGNLNRVELKKAVEKSYGVKVVNVNMINNTGKVKRSRSGYGRTSAFKKAIVTLSKDSKKLNLIEGTS